MAASRTLCLWLLLQLGVGEERFRLEVVQELAPDIGSPVLQPSEGGEEECSGRASNGFWCWQSRGVTERFGAPEGAWQVWAVPSHRDHSTSVGSVMTPGGLGLVCGGKQEGALWVLWCAVCTKAEEELGLRPSSSLTDVVTNKNGNPTVHPYKLPACGFPLRQSCLLDLGS